MSLKVQTVSFSAFAALMIMLVAVANPALAQSVQREVGDEIMMGGAWCPKGALPAEGQLLPINQNQVLYERFGTRYGGDGRTSFALPDLRGGPVTRCIFDSAVFGDRYVGEVFTSGGQCPQGSVAADGRSLSVGDAEALFSLFGSKYGGDGRSYFNVPRLNDGPRTYCVSVDGQYPHNH